MGCLPKLPLRTPLRLGQQAARNTLLQYLHHKGYGIPPWFTDQDMDVLWHNHVSDDLEAVALAYLLEDSQKDVPRMGTAQERLTLIAARGDEV
jgi:hypothetical protein